MFSTKEIDVKSDSEIEKEFSKVGDSLIWIRRFLTIGGIWPLDRTFIRASVWTLYLFLHLITEFAALYDALGDLNLTVLSILESVMQSLVFTKLIVFRYSKTLRNLINLIKKDFREENYDSVAEKRIYLKYNYWGKLYYKFSMSYVGSCTVLYYARPLIGYFISSSGNSSLSLPFRTKYFFEVSERMKYFIYFYQCPMTYLLVVHNTWICLLITVITHICGQLAILEYRIKKINTNGDSRFVYRKLVQRHMKSVRMSRIFDNGCSFLLLIDLTGMTILLGLMGYVIVAGADNASSSNTYIYIVCALATVLLLYGYCIVGECLIEESSKIHEAYYRCLWYESSQHFKKNLIICMIRTAEPLKLTAGKFFVFSLNGFTDVLKSAMGYISMLRKVAE